jgi:hypothetical protein
MLFYQLLGTLHADLSNAPHPVAFRCQTRFAPADLRRIPLLAGSQVGIQGIDRAEIFGSDGRFSGAGMGFLPALRDVRPQPVRGAARHRGGARA